MMAFFHAHPLVTKLAVGFAGGFVSAVEADRAAFKTWSSFSDIKKFNWSLAAFNYLKGGVIGAGTVLSATGILSVTGVS